MDIERLKELREEVFEDYKAYMVKNLKDEDGKVYPSIVPLDECSPIGKDLLRLINEAIARQSVKGEDVAEAIELFEGAIKYRKDQEEEVKKHYGGKLPDFYLDLNRKEALAITALQAYQPTTRKNRIAEEVAISKTETNTCELLNHNMNYKKCSSCNYLIHVYVNKPNYCPNCGRRLKENE